jgi:hypothetical protein
MPMRTAKIAASDAMRTPRHPSCYEINTRVWLTENSQKLGRAATLDDIADAELDRLAEMGFDWVWFLSVWQTGLAGRCVARRNQMWRKEFQETLPDLREEDMGGPGLPSPATRRMSIWEEMPLWLACARNSTSAACV